MVVVWQHSFSINKVTHLEVTRLTRQVINLTPVFVGTVLFVGIVPALLFSLAIGNSETFQRICPCILELSILHFAESWSAYAQFCRESLVAILLCGKSVIGALSERNTQWQQVPWWIALSEEKVGISSLHLLS